MEQSQEWVNSKYIKKQVKPRKKRAVQKRNNGGTAINAAKRRMAPPSAATTARSQSKAPSFLETISSISQKIDLPRIKSQLSEVNEIVHQVGGVIEQINQWRRPVYREPGPPSYPSTEIDRSTGSQPVHHNRNFR